MVNNKILKLGFLFVIGIFVVFVLFNQFSKDNTQPKEEVEVDNEEKVDVNLDEIELDELKDKYEEKENLNESDEKTGDLEEVYESVDDVKDAKYIVENSDVKDDFIEVHGEKAMKEVNESRSKLIDLYLQDNFKFPDWEGLITKSEFEEVKNHKDSQLIKDLLNSEDIEYETHYVAVTEDELVVEVEVKWSDAIDGVGSSGYQINMFYFVFDMTGKDKKAVSMTVV